MAPDCILTQIKCPPAKIIRRSGGHVKKKHKYGHCYVHIHTHSRPKCSCSICLCIVEVIIEKSQTVDLVLFLVQNSEDFEEISQGFINSMCMHCICGVLLITLRRGNMFTVNRLIMEA